MGYNTDHKPSHDRLAESWRQAGWEGFLYGSRRQGVLRFPPLLTLVAGGLPALQRQEK